MGPSTGQFAKQERALFQGFVVPLVALIGLWPPMSAIRIGYLLAMLLAFDVSLGLNGISYGFLHTLRPALPRPASPRSHGDTRRPVAVDSCRLWNRPPLGSPLAAGRIRRRLRRRPACLR